MAKNKTTNVTKRRNYKTAPNTKWQLLKTAKLQNSDYYKTAKNNIKKNLPNFLQKSFND